MYAYSPQSYYHPAPAPCDFDALLGQFLGRNVVSPPKVFVSQAHLADGSYQIEITRNRPSDFADYLITFHQRSTISELKISSERDGFAKTFRFASGDYDLTQTSFETGANTLTVRVPVGAALAARYRDAASQREIACQREAARQVEAARQEELRLQEEADRLVKFYETKLAQINKQKEAARLARLAAAEAEKAMAAAVQAREAERVKEAEKAKEAADKAKEAEKAKEAADKAKEVEEAKEAADKAEEAEKIKVVEAAKAAAASKQREAHLEQQARARSQQAQNYQRQMEEAQRQFYQFLSGLQTPVQVQVAPTAVKVPATAKQDSPTSSPTTSPVKVKVATPTAVKTAAPAPSEATPAAAESAPASPVVTPQAALEPVTPPTSQPGSPVITSQLLRTPSLEVVEDAEFKGSH